MAATGMVAEMGPAYYLGTCQLRDRISLESTSEVVGRFVHSWLHQHFQVVWNSRRVLLERILPRPVRVAGEKHNAAAVRSKAAEESEDQCCLSEMYHLKGLFVAVYGDVCVTD